MCDSIGIIADLRVRLASYLFEGENDHWWDSMKQMNVVDIVTREMFDQIFQYKYFPESVKDRMGANFLALKQGSMQLTEYEIKFDEHSRYVIEFVDTGAKKAKCFEQGLRPSIREKLVAIRI